MGHGIVSIIESDQRETADKVLFFIFLGVLVLGHLVFGLFMAIKGRKRRKEVKRREEKYLMRLENNKLKKWKATIRFTDSMNKIQLLIYIVSFYWLFAHVKYVNVFFSYFCCFNNLCNIYFNQHINGENEMISVCHLNNSNNSHICIAIGKSMTKMMNRCNGITMYKCFNCLRLIA